MAPELAARLLGSADLFESSGRKAWASVNLVTAHDGFTLQDLVSYEHRHNEANGEANRDGHGENWSANHGVEGLSAEPAIQAARARHKRNLLATLLLAQGTPMLQMGDELVGHSGATTTPTARTTRSPGSTGRPPPARIKPSPALCGGSRPCALHIRRCVGGAFFTASRGRPKAHRTSRGWPRTAGRSDR